MSDSASWGPESAERLSELDRRYVWHPFTPMQEWMGDEPLIVREAEGFELIDTRGRRYIDGFSSLWCNLHGHRAAEIDEAIRGQLDRVAHTTLLGFASPPSIELAERLVRISPAGLEKVFYSDSGATAVEIALKMAYQFWHNRGETKRTRFIALRDSYHGDTIGSVSVGGIEEFHRIFHPLLFETDFVDTPNPYHNAAGEADGRGVLAEIDRLLESQPQSYCGVIVEPLVQGAAGMLTHPEGFLAGVREISRRRGVLMIADEVATGFCRTGRLFACEHESVCPDLMCLGKGLTGGYLPVAATMATREVFDAFLGEAAEGRTFYHGHTFTGNALGCAAAVASVDRIFSSGLLESLPAKVALLRDRLGRLRGHPHVGDIRQCGLMAGIELVRRRDPDEPFDAKRRVARSLCLAAREHGLIIRPLGEVVILMPAPAMDLSTLGRMMDAVEATFATFFGDGDGDGGGRTS
jgi:adenosylmethionine-8-amino-7-oxononanoate aminotransferase